ncbi:MAG: HAD hydrolase-like protein [Candidatus Humimicrobiaceae bacterium]
MMSPERLTNKDLKNDPEVQLKKFKRTKDFFIAIDTDGCITDNMNGKQMLIFHPQFMEFYDLWKIETYFREVAEYYNLFSVDRGCNRFVAISLTLKALDQRKDVDEVLPDVDLLDKYIAYTKEQNLGLGNPSLEAYLDSNPTDLFYYKLLGWSEAVNRTFPHISAKIPPFSGVKETLEEMAGFADVVVVSKTPYEDLVNYWEDQGIDKYVQVIAGQEMGSKGHHIEVARTAGEYGGDEVLMLGDGNGDLKAVKANNGLFYPVTPGREQQCWNNISDTLNRFKDKEYRGSFEETLLKGFKEALLTIPPWEEEGYDHKKAYLEKQPIRKELYERFNPEGSLAIL